MVPSTVVMPREGSFALASFGRVRKVQEPTFAVAAGRKSFALKRILEAVLAIHHPHSVPELPTAIGDRELVSDIGQYPFSGTFATRGIYNGSFIRFGLARPPRARSSEGRRGRRGGKRRAVLREDVDAA